MADILLIAGTADARKLAAELAKLNINIIATVATDFGSQLLGERKNLEIHTGRLDAIALYEFIKSQAIKCVVDASHPYASEVSKNAINACKQANIEYIRYERNETNFESINVVIVKGYKEAAELAAKLEGNVFLTVGSNSLGFFTESIVDYKSRLFVRVLPDSKVMLKCEQHGLTASNILAVKGPFNEEMNFEMLKHCATRIMVTKDSGTEGGTVEKLKAAERLGIKVIMVERPDVQYTNVLNNIDDVLEKVKIILNM